jgi:enamine deaminase RidA (YjgF/YER057c/UK114 family)
VEAQIVAALDRVRAAMERAGSSMDKIIRTTMMLHRIGDYPRMQRVETAYYERHAPALISDPPASTFIQLPAITTPDRLFQIDAIGVA